MAEIPHFAIPFRFKGSKAVEVEQDSTDEIAACCEAIVRTKTGQRSELPDFGIDDPVFTTHTDDLVKHIREKIEEWEPRAETVVSEEWDLDDWIRNVAIYVDRQE